MNEVEKMYRNAHVYPRVYGDITKETFENKVFNMADMCNEAFTAEKQLELIKWLINEVDYITMWHFNNSKKPYDFDLGSRNSGGETFEDALAQMINNLWQDLTEEERKQIKNILESEVRE